MRRDGKDPTAKQRTARWRRKHPTEARASWRKSTAKYEKTEKGIRARVNRRARATKPVAVDKGMHATEARLLDRPNLAYLDKHGRLHYEQELSAEELIRAYERSKRKK